jgi:hypothetical protein
LGGGREEREAEERICTASVWGSHSALMPTSPPSLFFPFPPSSAGSGSTYIYGHVDEAFKENMTREECQNFVKKGGFFPFPSLVSPLPPKLSMPVSSSLQQSSLALVLLAISHAMARDGSSGGVIRMVTIDKTGVSREFIPGREGEREGGREGDSGVWIDGRIV